MPDCPAIDYNPLHTIIKARRGLARLDLAEVWQARELLGFLAWRDIVVRYKQTSIGILWAFLRPFLTMVIFTVVFGRIAKLPSDNVPYAVFTFTRFDGKVVEMWSYATDYVRRLDTTIVFIDGRVQEIKTLPCYEPD